MREWLKRQRRELRLLPQYFSLVFTRWQALLWGASLLAVTWGLWFIVGAPPTWVNWAVVLFALFMAGFYVWREDHVRLLPQFDVEEFHRQRTPTSDLAGRPTGESVYVQLLPKCLTEANVEECRGILTSIDRWNGLNTEWETIESEAMFLQWSHGDEKTGHLPITLYPEAENRLNILYIHSSDQKIRPCATPFPLRFQSLFDGTPWATFAYRFNIRLTAKDCAPVAVSLTVQTGNDPLNPSIELSEPDSDEGQQ